MRYYYRIACTTGYPSIQVFRESDGVVVMEFLGAGALDRARKYVKRKNNGL